MDIEAILEMYEDDYNPSSTVPGPRNMYNEGQLVRNTVDGSRPGYAGVSHSTTNTTKTINKLNLDKKKIKLNGDDFITGKVQSYVPKGVGKKYVDEYLSFVDKNYLKMICLK